VNIHFQAFYTGDILGRNASVLFEKQSD